MSNKEVSFSARVEVLEFFDTQREAERFIERIKDQYNIVNTELRDDDGNEIMYEG